MGSKYVLYNLYTVYSLCTHVPDVTADVWISYRFRCSKDYPAFCWSTTSHYSILRHISTWRHISILDSTVQLWRAASACQLQSFIVIFCHDACSSGDGASCVCWDIIMMHVCRPIMVHHAYLQWCAVAMFFFSATFFFNFSLDGFHRNLYTLTRYPWLIE